MTRRFNPYLRNACSLGHEIERLFFSRHPIAHGGARVGAARAGEATLSNTMPPKPSTSLHLDVLIVTALKEEYDAVLKVDTGSLPGSTWEPLQDPVSRNFSARSFVTASGGTLRVAVIQALDMGASSAVGIVSPLVRAYRPRCLAICGVCAGRPGKVELGDVLIAGRLWNYEAGKHTRLGDGSERFESLDHGHELDPQWLQQARSFQPAATSAWLSERPRAYQAQLEWMLERLVREEAPAQHPQHPERCPDHTEVVKRLLARKWARFHGAKLRLTKTGRQHLERLRVLHPNGLPEPPPFRVHVGTIATGTKVIRDSTIFEQLSARDPNVLGLEMEASEIATLAHQTRVEFMIAVKGVTDFADEEKNDHFKAFAARASAECLLAFLRENLPATSTCAPLPRAPQPRALIEAMAEYKRDLANDKRIRCHDLRGLTGITPGRHETELELLKFAVAPSLHDEAEEDGSREATLQNELRKRDLPPTLKRERVRELRQLQDRRWSPHGPRVDRWDICISFAEALSRYQRLVVIGDPGTGESVLTRLAFLACMGEALGHEARRLLGGDDPLRPHAHDAIMALRELLPVRITLGGLGNALAEEPRLSFMEYLRRQIPEQGPGAVLRNSLEALLKHGQLLLLCDGLDEVPEAQRKRLVDGLTEFLDRAPKVRFLLTSRPHGYRPRLPGLQHTRLATLDSWQQRKLVSRLHRMVEADGQEDAASIARAHRRSQALLQAIRRPGWDLLSSNPLLLTLTALTRTDDQGVPRHRVIVFENFALTLLGEWRSLVATAGEAERLLEVWTSAAFELVLKEKRHGVVKAEMLDVLSAAIAAHPRRGSLTAQDALHLALEAGLISLKEGMVTFWHSLFTEFLAARWLTRKGAGAATRLLKTAHLPQLVLQLAAARLYHVLEAHAELDTLITGLLARDEFGAEQLLRSGLRAASACLMESVSFAPELILRIWSQWAEFLERMPPSPAWWDFEQLAGQAASVNLPAELLERFARLDDRGVAEVQHGVAQLLALSSGPLPPAARETCLRVVRRPYYSKHAFWGALGLSSTGEWSHEVIMALGRLGERSRSDVIMVSERVRRGLRHEPRVRDLLRGLVRSRLPSEEPRPSGAPGQPAAPASNEDARRDLRLSAAALLALGGEWDDEVARVLSLGLSVQTLGNRMEDVKEVIKHCAEQRPVHESLLAWAEDRAELGRYARELVGELAPFIDGLPEKALELTVRSTEASRQALEGMMASIGEYQRSLLDTLRQWLGHEDKERRFCAARILLRLVPQDEELHAALHRGIATGEQDSRVRWAHLAFNREEELTDAAVTTLQDCARSPDPEVRKAVYSEDFERQFQLVAKRKEGWIACATNSALSGSIRLDAVTFLVRTSSDTKQAVSLLRPLLDSEDQAVRQQAASVLIHYDHTDLRAAAITAEAAACRLESEWPIFLRERTLASAEVTRAILRGLPREMPSKSYEEWNSPWRRWGSILAEVASANLSCAKDLLEAVELPGIVGEAATRALEALTREDSQARFAIRERLIQTAKGDSPKVLFRLIRLGLAHDETKLLAVEASRALAPGVLSQAQLNWIARRIPAQASEDAVRMWRIALDGANPRLVLDAAAELARAFPEKAGEWIQPALLGLFDDPAPLLRVCAARIALARGLIEEPAVAALSDCMELRHPYEHDLAHHWTVEAIDARDRHSDLAVHQLLETLRHETRRVDFEALRALLVHRPELGMARLTAWLEDPDLERFTIAVKLLVARGYSRELVSAAFLARVGSAAAESLPDVTALADVHGFYSPEIVERVLARYEPGHPSSSEFLRCLDRWVETQPEVWAILRRQDQARRESFDDFLVMNPPPSRDAIAFAVDSVLRHCDEVFFGPPAKWVIDRWCRPSKDEEEKHRPPGGTPLPPPEKIRGWLREALLEQAPPEALEAILCFDNLAALGELPPDHRLRILRLALAADTDALQPDSREYLVTLGAQTVAAARMLELHGQDERIHRVLQTALRTFAKRSASDTLFTVCALRALQPEAAEIPRALLFTLVNSDAPDIVDQLLEALSQAGLSRDEIVDAVGVCLGIERESRPPSLPPIKGEYWRDKAPQVLDALEKWGCPLPLRESLVGRFIRLQEEKLPPRVAMTLADRPEPSPALVARLLLVVLAQVDGLDAELVPKKWLARFAARPGEEDTEKLWLSSWKTSLRIRLQVLSRLARVEEPALVERCLAELARIPADAFLATYHRALSGAQLTDSEWADLVGWLSSRPGDADTLRFAREWLNLGLWNALAPAAVESLIRPE